MDNGQASHKVASRLFPVEDVSQRKSLQEMEDRIRVAGYQGDSDGANPQDCNRTPGDPFGPGSARNKRYGDQEAGKRDQSIDQTLNQNGGEGAPRSNRTTSTHEVGTADFAEPQWEHIVQQIAFVQSVECPPKFHARAKQDMPAPSPRHQSQEYESRRRQEKPVVCRFNRLEETGRLNAPEDGHERNCADDHAQEPAAGAVGAALFFGNHHGAGGLDTKILGLHGSGIAAL